MEDDKKYNMCESIVKSRQNSRLIFTILKFDRSLSVDDLVNEVYLHHHVKNIYPNPLTVIRFLQNFGTAQFRLKRADNRKNVLEFDVERVEYQNGIMDSNIKIDLEKALSNLRKRDRKIIYLYFFEGLTYDDIGVLYHVSGETIRLWMKRAISKIRRSFNGIEINL